MKKVSSLKELIEKLPPDLQKELQDYAEFLLEKKKGKTKNKPRFDWSGALKDLKSQYTSVELQHKASEWRIGGE